MILVDKRRYVRKYIVGGGGIFDTVINVIRKIAGSPITGAIAKSLAKSVASAAGKKLVESVASPENYTVQTPPAPQISIQQAIKANSPIVAQKAQDLVAKYTAPTKGAPATSGTGNNIVSVKEFIKLAPSKVGSGLKIII